MHQSTPYDRMVSKEISILKVTLIFNNLLSTFSGPRCQLAARCTNKRFQKRQYGKIEVFNTEKKGVGLRALQDMDP